jgi:chromosomal replication initiator protein
LRVPRDVLEFVAGRFTAHARQLSGALCRLEAASRASGRVIDRSLADESLADMVQSATRPVRLADIEKAVCDAFGLEPSSLQSNRKGKRVSQPRMLAMWLARKYTRSALTEIGQFFGRRSHSTVISAQKRVDAWLADGNVLQWADQVFPADDAIRKVEQRLLAS